MGEGFGVRHHEVGAIGQNLNRLPHDFWVRIPMRAMSLEGIALSE
jgi:hypothetical protein